MVLSASQREARATRVGASEVAALMGEHPYMTESDVYARIVDGVSREPSINMLVGAALEPHVLKLARDLLGLTGARGCSRAYIHPTLPLCASPDAFYGRTGLVEVKVTGAWSAIPGHVWWQAQTQMMLTARDFVVLVVLAGSSLTSVNIVHDLHAWARIIQEVGRFNENHLGPRIRPVTPPFTFKDTSKERVNV